MIYDKTGFLIINYSDIIKYNNYLTYLIKRITQDCAENKDKAQSIINVLNTCNSTDKFTDILSDIYPKGILYDDVIWKWEDYEIVLFFLSKDEENIKRIKKNKKK